MRTVRHWISIILLLLSSSLISCKGSENTFEKIYISISPKAVAMAQGRTQTFFAQVTGMSNTAVTWSIQEGNSGGSITDVGVYKAPDYSGVFHVIASSQADLTMIASATVTVVPPGTVDLSFGNSGIVTTLISDTTNGAMAIAIQPDGKIVTVGQAIMKSTSDFVVVRYNEDGSLDNNFGNNGVVTTDLSGSDVATAVAIQTDGKIVVGGNSSNLTHNDFVLVRYNLDGNLDSTFGDGGKVMIPMGRNSGFASAVVIQKDGKILEAGSSFYSPQFVLVRYNSDGSLDTGFGVGGIVSTDLGPAYGGANCMAVQDDGKIILAGYIGTNRIFALARYNLDGSLDSSFGIGGVVTALPSLGLNEVVGVAIQSDGKIVAAGTSIYVENYDIALVRYEGNGQLDTTFGNQGKVIVSKSNNSDDVVNSIVLQSDGKIVISGWMEDFGDPAKIAVLRFNPDGSLDDSFGGGWVTTQVKRDHSGAYSLALQSDGRIVAAGVTFVSSFPSRGAFVLVRYWP